jgi:TetR/AcrR family transcriptional regulator
MSSKTPPTSVRTRDATATRQALLDAAQTVFAERGFSGARIDDIARVSGYNKSLIFQYFTDKAGIYQAVVQRLRSTSDAASGAALSAVIDSSRLTRDGIETLLNASVAWSFSHLVNEPQYLRLFSWEMAEGWKAFEAAAVIETEHETEQSSQWGLGLLREAQRLGITRADITSETILVQLNLLPFFTLASIPRFRTVYGEADQPKLLEQLREQATRAIVHLALPDV